MLLLLFTIVYLRTECSANIFLRKKSKERERWRKEGGKGEWGGGWEVDGGRQAVSVVVILGNCFCPVRSCRICQVEENGDQFVF